MYLQLVKVKIFICNKAIQTESEISKREPSQHYNVIQPIPNF